MRKATVISKEVQYYGAAVGVLHSLMPKGRLRVGNLLWKSHVRVENYSPLGVVCHPNQQILGHCCSMVKSLRQVHFSHPTNHYISVVPKRWFVTPFGVTESFWGGSDRLSTRVIYFTFFLIIWHRTLHWRIPKTNFQHLWGTWSQLF